MKVADDPVVRENLQLIVGKNHALKEVVFLSTDEAETAFFQFTPGAAGAGSTMMAVSDVKIRHVRECLDECVRIRHAPDRVTNLIVRNEVVERFVRSEEHTSELQSRLHLVCRLLLEKKK